MVYGRSGGDVASSVDFNRLRTEKRERARRSMEKHNLDAVICFRPENIRYLTVGPTFTVFRYCIFPRNSRHEPIHYEQGMTAYSFKTPGTEFKVGLALPSRSFTLPEQVRNIQIKKFTAQIKQALKEYGILDGKIGVDLPSPYYMMLEKEGINISPDGQQALLEARKIKTRDEIELMRIACTLVEAAFQRIREVIRPGITEKEVYAEAVKKCLEAGAEHMMGGMICSGPHTWPFSLSNTDRIIRPGDLVVVDWMMMEYYGYHTCYYRCFSCGKPTEAQKEAWAKAREFTYNAFKVMKAGATTKDMAECWPKAQDYGFPDEDAAFLSQTAHGIGLDQQEDPIVSRLWSLDYPEVLESGNVLAVETLWPTNEKSPDYPNGQCLRIEEMVAITDTGIDLLSKWPVDGITECEPL